MMINKENNFDEIVDRMLQQFDLASVSDEVFNFCLKVMQSPKFNWNMSIDSKGNLLFKNNLITLCNTNISIKQALGWIEDANNVDKLFYKSNGSFATNTFIKRCFERCEHADCPKIVLAAMLILKERGKLDEIIESKPAPIGFFKFNWNRKGELRKIPENIFRLAQKLVNDHQIWVGPNLTDNGFIRIRSAHKCLNIMSGDSESICYMTEENVADKGHYREFTRSLNQSLCSYCTTMQCGRSACVFLVAGYLYYLIQSGNVKEIDLEREYYRENEKEVVEEANCRYESKMKSFLSSRFDDKMIESFEIFRENVENLDLLSRSIANKDRTNLYFAIEREEGVDESDEIAAIERALKSAGKITKKQNFPIWSLYDDAKRCADNILTIVSGISAFKELDKKDNNRYTKKTSLINLLCNPVKNKYIVVVGTKTELSFLEEYSPKFKYVYDHFRIRVKNLTVNQLYKIYQSNLDPIVVDELVQNERSAKARFDDFVANNRSIFPFKNTDFAKYMAQYSNSLGHLELPPYAYHSQTLDDALGAVVGMENIKQQIKDLEQYIAFMNRAKSTGLKIPSMNLHMILTGNPGTGKTMMARITAKMLYDLGVIKENKLIEVERKDLIAKYLGQTAAMTSAVIDKAIGGVLFIDEAYSLVPKENEKDYGQEAIATIIKAMEDHKNELVVIFAGYKDEMKRFVDSNPGIASRIGYTFDFPDYSPNELIKILKIKLQNNGFVIYEEAMEKALQLAKVVSKRKNFGNGRFVDKLVQQILINHSKQSQSNISIISESAIPTIEQFYGEVTMKNIKSVQMEDIIGMETLKQQVLEFADYVAFSKMANNAGLNLPTQNMHMMFTGNPGCGKTTIARIIAKILFDMDVIHENKLVEVCCEDLTSRYAGGPARRTAEIIDKAMGGVLFIDEAYSMAKTGSGGMTWDSQEIITTLIKAMEDHKGELIVIFAGYKKEMKQFINSNPGIASRIGYTFDFPDYTAEELTQIFKLKISKAGFAITDAADDAVLKIMKYFHRVENIGNGRFVDRIVQMTTTKHARLAVHGNLSDICEIDVDSIPNIDEIISLLSNGSTMLRSESIDEQSIRKTAMHEIGHAYISYKLFDSPNIVKITINAEGAGSLGYVQHNRVRQATNSKTELSNEIKMLLAGMCSEEIFNGEFENGNTSDLKRATHIANCMVTQYGMSDLGFAQITYPNQMAEQVQNEVNKILSTCYEETKRIITENKSQVEKLIEYLLDSKELSGDEFIRLVSQTEN